MASDAIYRFINVSEFILDRFATVQNLVPVSRRRFEQVDYAWSKKTLTKLEINADRNYMAYVEPEDLQNLIETVERYIYIFAFNPYHDWHIAPDVFYDAAATWYRLKECCLE